ncbi:hypothetical protein BOX15_Mlig009227g2 [Macrostomum lignano]|uniref:Autophagy-related protein 101 n=1 Tax=Macrostomum lignano TaxID=282301 RepID=A0A267H4T9_9PLAT|nr:hypothetical protein BOX15_Mlig009227g2 [Macrostomum lignano]
MNVQKHTFSFDLEGMEVEEVVRSVFHTVLLHRCYAKISVKEGGNTWTVGAAGLTDEDCESIEVTYTRVSCDEVVNKVNQPIQAFVKQLRSGQSSERGTGSVALEFHEQKRAKWGVFASDPVPWEIWIVHVNLTSFDTETARSAHRDKLTQVVTDAIFYINDTMVNPDTYKPKLARTGDFDQILDMQCPLLTPHHFRVHYSTCNDDPVQATMGGAVKKILKDTLAL